MIGGTFSHYKNLERIGEGIIGDVYLAKDTKLAREVAVKVLPSILSEDSERLHCFDLLDDANIWMLTLTEERE